jgi:hypothetical protein
LDLSTGGEVANALVCKTSIRRFNSGPVLHLIKVLLSHHQLMSFTGVGNNSAPAVEYSNATNPLSRSVSSLEARQGWRITRQRCLQYRMKAPVRLRCYAQGRVLEIDTASDHDQGSRFKRGRAGCEAQM